MSHPESPDHSHREEREPCVVLVDGTYHLFRAYHALPPLHNRDGEPTGALYGTLRIITRLRHTHRPEKLVAVFDAGGKNFRHDLLAGYKQNRPPPPNDLVAQIEPLKSLLCALGIPVVSLDNTEADDVIATLARRARRQGWYVIIATGDKDLAQLVNPDIVLEDRHGAILDSAAVKKKYGVQPDRIIDLISLTGDSVDNIPGVEKVGPVTATKWIERFGDLDNILDQAHTVRGKQGENLRSRVGQIRKNRALVTLRDDLESVPDWASLAMRAVDQPVLRELCGKWQLRQLLETEMRNAPKNAPGPANESPDEVSPTDCQHILTKADMEKWSHRLQNEKRFAVAIKTDDAHPLRAGLTGVAFALESGKTAFAPLSCNNSALPRHRENGVTPGHIRTAFTCSGEKLFHNLKRHIQVMEHHDIPIRGAVTDTMLEAYVLDSGGDYADLHATAERVLTTTEKKADHRTDGAGENPAEGAALCLRLHLALEKRLTGHPTFEKVLRTIEMPVVPVLARMERYGVRIDKQNLYGQSRDLEQEIKDIEAQANENIDDGPINLNSSKQVRELLFDRLKLPVVQKTPSGVPSSSERVLQELADSHPLPGLILRHRMLSKLKSTYTDPLPEQADENERVHTTYHQAKVVTGRLSSSGPNLQNIPVRTPEGRRIRSAFIAAPGHVLLTADYSQIELRIIAHLANDPAMLTIFAGNGDVHRQTAAEIFGLSPDDVRDEQRRIAKSINFGLIYGMSPFGLSRQLRISLEAANHYVERFFHNYPRIGVFMEHCRQQAKRNGYVETLFGRRIPTPEAVRRADRQHAQRMAINAPMQGTAADIIKKAMISIDEWLIKRQYSVHMIMQVHDELVFEVPGGQEEEAMATIRRLMEKADDGLLQSSLKVNIATGSSWEGAH